MYLFILDPTAGPTSFFLPVHQCFILEALGPRLTLFLSGQSVWEGGSPTAIPLVLVGGTACVMCRSPSSGICSCCSRPPSFLCCTRGILSIGIGSNNTQAKGKRKMVDFFFHRMIFFNFKKKASLPTSVRPANDQLSPPVESKFFPLVGFFFHFYLSFWVNCNSNFYKLEVSNPQSKKKFLYIETPTLQSRTTIEVVAL